MEKTKEELKSRRDAFGITLGLVVGLLLLLLTGCSTVKEKEYYENGQVKRDYQREGFIDWSDGAGKNMPLSHLSVNGVGVGK